MSARIKLLYVLWLVTGGARQGIERSGHAVPQEAASDRDDLRRIRKPGDIDNSITLDLHGAEHGGEVIFRAGIEHGQSVCHGWSLAHDRHEQRHNLRRLPQAAHCVKRRAQHVRPLPRVHPDLADIGQDHGQAVMVISAISDFVPSARLRTVISATPSPTPVTSPACVTVAIDVSDDW